MRTFFFLNKSQTILSAYLDLLNVKHTKKYADKLYNTSVNFYRKIKS